MTLGTGSGFLHVAIRTGELEAVEALLKAGADPNRIDGQGWTPLNAAVAGLNGKGTPLAIIDALLQAGADPNQPGGKSNEPFKTETMSIGRTREHPLAIAITLGFPETVELLLEAGANPNQLFDTGVTPLHLAVISARANIVEKATIAEALLEAGADPNRPDLTSGMTPLDFALHQNLAVVVGILRNAGAKR